MAKDKAKELRAQLAEAEEAEATELARQEEEEDTELAAEREIELADRAERKLQRIRAPRETIVVMDEVSRTGFRVNASHYDISDEFPNTCRWLPNYRLIRRNGAIAGGMLAAAMVLVGVVAGLQGYPDLGYPIGFGGVFLTAPMVILGWFFAPLYSLHDYKSFSVVRRITLDSNLPKPEGAWDKTDEHEGMTTYLVPYEHTFLNLASPSQELDDEFEPFVARATILYKDSFQKSLAFVMAAKLDAWSRMKQYALIGLIAAELIFLFLMMNIMMGQ